MKMFVIYYAAAVRTLTDGNRASQPHTTQQSNKFEAMCRAPRVIPLIFCEDFSVFFFVRLVVNDVLAADLATHLVLIANENDGKRPRTPIRFVSFASFSLIHSTVSVCLSTIANCYCCGAQSNVIIEEKEIRNYTVVLWSLIKSIF